MTMNCGLTENYNSFNRVSETLTKKSGLFFVYEILLFRAATSHVSR